MNCSNVLRDMGFECKQLSDKMLRVWSPFTYGIDGEVIGFYVEQTNAGYRVTDGAQALRHAESVGIELNKKRLEVLRSIAGGSANISSGGEISASAGGLILWPAKVLVPIGFVLLILQGLSELVKRIAFLRGLAPDPTERYHVKSAEEELAEEILKQRGENP